MTEKTLWQSVEKTDPKYTKTFTRGGGFKGTAINATWLAKRASETFGPMGLGWGVEIVEEKIIDGAPWYFDHKEGETVIEKEIVGCDKIHQIRIKLWYIHNEKRGEITHFGQTQFVGRNKTGIFTDEEAPKKSLTDATTKALSMLGFAADVHMGLFDDNKYVNDRMAEEAAKDAPTKEDYSKQRKFINELNACKDKYALAAWYAENEAGINELPVNEMQVVNDQYEARLAQFNSGVAIVHTFKFSDTKEMNAWMLEVKPRIEACDSVSELAEWEESNKPKLTALDAKRKTSMRELIQAKLTAIETAQKNTLAGG